MPSKILVPVDGSANSKRALEKAVTMAKDSSSSVTALYVMEKPPTVYIESQKVLDDAMAKYKKEADAVLDEYEALATGRGVKIEAVMAQGEPATTIVNYTEKGGFDMIVMGSRGRGKITEAVLGSVSSKVLKDAKCPVVIVK
ncbi:MAG: universal stress protein [Nitrososphaera sp.]|uniref:universal stress protein n=1 Tax=Nitrososphaera sp. TaxID=1971748 RepID=UPI003D6FE38A